MSDISNDVIDETLSTARLTQLDDAYFHLILTGVAPNIEWDDLRERMLAYRELNELRATLEKIGFAWTAYRNRGVSPAPNEYQQLSKTLNEAFSLDARRRSAGGSDGK